MAEVYTSNYRLDRVSWEEYFMTIAEIVSKRSTCLRRHIGAVIVKTYPNTNEGPHIIATGYNGSPRGCKHCSELGGCLREQLHVPSGERQEICRAVHAEANAIVQAASYGTSCYDGILYCTHKPCSMCTKLIINSGIRKIYYKNDYPDELATKLLEESGIECIKL